MKALPKWDQYYSKDLSWSDFFRMPSDYGPVLECIIVENPKKVLEVGCGRGGKSIFLSYLGIECTAVDNNPEILAMAQRHAEHLRGRVRFLPRDAFALEFPDDSFDVVHHAGFFEHFSDEDIQRMLREQLRVARKVVFCVPNEHYPTQDYGNERLLSRAQWEHIMREWKIEVSEYFLPRYSSSVAGLLWQGFNRVVLHRDVRKSWFYLAKVSRK